MLPRRPSSSCLLVLSLAFSAGAYAGPHGHGQGQPAPMPVPQQQAPRQRAVDPLSDIAHEQRVVDRPRFSRLVLIHVGEIGDLREREERNAERQDDVERAVTCASHGIDGCDEHVRVLEIPE
jgi:hypothetical protein